MATTPVALVTGANQGIGLQVAKDLAARGYAVLVGARDVEKGQRAAAEVGHGAAALQLDVNDPTSIAAAAAHVSEQYGRLDVLVNNAAISHAGAPGTSIEQIFQAGLAATAKLDDVRAVFDTNVFGVLAVTQALLPLLRQVPEGRIVNVSSAGGSLALASDPSWPHRAGFGVTYAASKTALNAITMAFAIELEDTNVKVNAVSPGFTATALNDFAGTDTVETGARDIVRLATAENGPTGTFVGPEGVLPW